MKKKILTHFVMIKMKVPASAPVSSSINSTALSMITVSDTAIANIILKKLRIKILLSPLLVLLNLF
jgi:hypothetical protein